MSVCLPDEWAEAVYLALTGNGADADEEALSSALELLQPDEDTRTTKEETKSYPPGDSPSATAEAPTASRTRGAVRDAGDEPQSTLDDEQQIELPTIHEIKSRLDWHQNQPYCPEDLDEGPCPGDTACPGLRHKTSGWVIQAIRGAIQSHREQPECPATPVAAGSAYGAGEGISHLPNDPPPSTNPPQPHECPVCGAVNDPECSLEGHWRSD